MIMHVDAPIVNATSIHGEVLDSDFHEPHVVFGLAQLAHNLAKNNNVVVPTLHGQVQAPNFIGHHLI